VLTLGRKVRLSFGSWAVFAAAFVGCGDDDVLEDVPPLPDLSAIAATYQNPTGTLAGADIDCLGAEARRRYEEDRLPVVRALLTDALQRLRDWLVAGGYATGPEVNTDEDDPRVEGVVKVTRICRGWDPAMTAPDEARNGRIDLNALIDSTGLRRVVWGNASNCMGRGDLAGRQVNLFMNTSTLEIQLYRGLQVGGDSIFLVKLVGELGTENRRENVDWDFLATTATVEIRLPTATGDVIASVSDTAVVLRGQDGTVTVGPNAVCGAQSMSGAEAGN
jgi:hypothetical protein